MKKVLFGFLVSSLVSATMWANEPAKQPLQSAQSLENQMDALSAQDTSGHFSAMFYEYECVARNERREHFEGHSHFPRKAEEIAMAKCYHYSRACVMEGCRPR